MPDIKVVRTAPREDGGPPAGGEGRVRQGVARVFAAVEDVAYVGLGGVLAAAALVLLAHGIIEFVQAVAAAAIPERIVGLLDRVLLVLMIVEILYTVQVSFREHSLVPEPFLIVGLIAATRRILVLTAEFSKLVEQGDAALRMAMWELGVLTAMVLALVVSLVMLRRRASTATADKT